jgi:hypothetical protein
LLRNADALGGAQCVAPLSGSQSVSCNLGYWRSSRRFFRPAS